MPQKKRTNRSGKRRPAYDQARDGRRTAQNTAGRSTAVRSGAGSPGHPITNPNFDPDAPRPSRYSERTVDYGSYPDNSIQFPAGGRSGASGQNRNRSTRSGQQRRPSGGGQNRRSGPNRQAAGGQRRPQNGQRMRPVQNGQRDPVRREGRKKRKLTRAAIRRQRAIRRLTALAMLLCVIGAGVYLTVTMLFKISSIQVQTADGVVQEAGGYTSDQILQALDVHLEENIFSFEPGEKAAVLEQNFPLLGSIKVIRDYPNTVVVQVTEAVPAYAVQNGSKWLVISDKWKILSEESTQPEGLCTLYGGKLQDTAPGQGFWFVDDADAASASGSETAESESTVSTETARMEALRTLVGKLEESGLSQDVTRLEVADTE